jgi:hypothetical protein
MQERKRADLLQVILPCHGEILVALDEKRDIMYGTELDGTPIEDSKVFYWWHELRDQVNY